MSKTSFRGCVGFMALAASASVLVVRAQQPVVEHSPTDEQIEWIEEDIKRTLAAIAGISNLTAWHWYVGDDDSKNRALKFYFLQIYGFEYPGL